MKTYTEAELVSFGKYLLGIERVTKFFDKKESFYEVHDSDLENWKEKKVNNNELMMSECNIPKSSTDKIIE